MRPHGKSQLPRDRWIPLRLLSNARLLFPFLHGVCVHGITPALSLPGSVGGGVKGPADHPA